MLQSRPWLWGRRWNSCGQLSPISCHQWLTFASWGYGLHHLSGCGNVRYHRCIARVVCRWCTVSPKSKSGRRRWKLWKYERRLGGGGAWCLRSKKWLTLAGEPAGRAELVSCGKARGERPQGNLERCLKCVRSPPRASPYTFIPLSHSLVGIHRAPPHPKLCNAAQDMVYFEVCAPYTRSIQLWRSVRCESVMRPLGWDE